MTASITEAEPSDSRPSESKLLILAFAFAAAWGMMQLFVVKQVPLDLTWLGIGLTSFVFAEFLFAVTYPITDVVTEVWGAQRARHVVYGGVIVNLLVMLLLSIAIALPAPEYWTAQNDAYTLLYEAAPRIWLASITAVFVSQILDIYVFNVIRNATGGRLLWLRNNASTIVSQGVDVIIFYSIAFYGSMPMDAFLSLLLGNYILKIVLAAIDTPIVYLLVKWAK